MKEFSVINLGLCEKEGSGVSLEKGNVDTSEVVNLGAVITYGVIEDSDILELKGIKDMLIKHLETEKLKVGLGLSGMSAEKSLELYYGVFNVDVLRYEKGQDALTSEDLDFVVDNIDSLLESKEVLHLGSHAFLVDFVDDSKDDYSDIVE